MELTKYNTLITTKGLKENIFKTILFNSIVFSIYFLLIGKHIHEGFIISICASILMFIAYSTFSYTKILYNEKQLLQNSIFNQNNITYQDRTKVVLFGRIGTNTEPLESAITKTKCIFFSYGVYNWVWKNSGKSRRREKDYFYTGHVLTPSSLNIGYKLINILSMPQTKNFTKATFKFSELTKQYYLNVQEYLKNTSLTNFSIRSISQIKDAIGIVKKTLLDLDGENRVDLIIKELAIPFEKTELEEEVIREGEHVVVIGVWDADKNGVITDPGITNLTIFKGKPDEVLNIFRKQIAGLISLIGLCVICVNVYMGYKAILLYNLTPYLQDLTSKLF